MFCSHKTISLFAIYIICLSYLFVLSVEFAVAVEPDCLESKTHKPIPTEERFLYGECKPWKNMACCNKTTSETIHLADTTWSNFNYDHCYRMSNKCKQRFLQEFCFYECDPYLHRYVVGDKSKNRRSERYYQIPLCKSDCNQWFDDCKYDYTCRDNWNKGFKWNKNGKNECPKYEKCTTFQEKFQTAENFCSRIWDYSFKVVDDSQSCFKFIFENENENKNKQVAERIEKELGN